jgi:hypothetical protein
MAPPKGCRWLIVVRVKLFVVRHTEPRINKLYPAEAGRHHKLDRFILVIEWQASEPPSVKDIGVTARK